MSEQKTDKAPVVKHLQTLVELNNCVGIGRRDAAFLCLADYSKSAEWTKSMDDPNQRLITYCRCLKLLREAWGSTKRSAIPFEHQSMIDRPVVHVLKLLLELVTAMQSLVAHIIMVEREAETLKELMGEEAYKVLLETCVNFLEGEARTRSSFLTMLPVGQMLLDSNTTHHRGVFTVDEKRRYNIAYEEYCRYYREHLNDEIKIDDNLLPEGSFFHGMK